MNHQKLYFDGPKESFAPNSEITISVLLDSTESINAFQLEINYEADKLKFLGGDNTGSIVDIWQTKPEGGADGQIELSGGILDSFSGTKGLLIKFSFRILETTNSVDTSKISFGRGDLYLADGKGTRVIALTSSTSVSIKKSSQVTTVPSIPFKPTESDILIEQKLETFKSQMFWEKALTPLLYFIVIIFVICLWAVYNKFKRKL